MREFEPLPRFHRPAQWDPERIRQVAADVSRALEGRFTRPADIPSHWLPMYGDLVPWNLREDERGQFWLLDWEDAGWGLGARGDDTMVNTSRLLALHAGALIYLGTFATANNFDYRLVFLLLTLPQLVEWASIPGDRLSSLAAATLVAIVVLLWVGSLSQWLNLWDELASWVVASLLTAVLAATLSSLNSVRRSVLGDVASVGVHP